MPSDPKAMGTVVNGVQGSGASDTTQGPGLPPEGGGGSPPGSILSTRPTPVSESGQAKGCEL